MRRRWRREDCFSIGEANAIYAQMLRLSKCNPRYAREISLGWIAATSMMSMDEAQPCPRTHDKLCRIVGTQKAPHKDYPADALVHGETMIESRRGVCSHPDPDRTENSEEVLCVSASVIVAGGQKVVIIIHRTCRDGVVNGPLREKSK